MSSIWGVVAGAILVACAPAAGSGSTPRSSAAAPAARTEDQSGPKLIAAISELTWTGSPPAKEFAASESGKRAIAALVTWGKAHPAIELPCNGPDSVSNALVERAIPFTMAVIVASGGPDDPKVTSLLQFAQALRREHNDGVAIMLGVKIPTALAAYWRDRSLSAGPFATLGPTDLDTVHMGQSMLACKVAFLQERKSALRAPDGQNAIKDARQRMGLSAGPGWLDAEFAAHDQFLAGLQQGAAAVHTGAAMVEFVRQQTRAGRESPSSALLRILSYGLEGDAIVSALERANLEIDKYQQFVAPAR